MKAETGYYLAGLADGEGCFVIARNSKGIAWRCGFVIHLREDDRPLLEWLCEETGLGHIANGRRTVGTGDRRDSPSVRWAVGRRLECVVLVEIFRRYPLRSKKARDFEIWAKAVRAWGRQSWGEIARLSELLKETRTFSSEWMPEFLEDPAPQLELVSE